MPRDILFAVRYKFYPSCASFLYRSSLRNRFCNAQTVILHNNVPSSSQHSYQQRVIIEALLEMFSAGIFYLLISGFLTPMPLWAIMIIPGPKRERPKLQKNVSTPSIRNSDKRSEAHYYENPALSG